MQKRINERTVSVELRKYDTVYACDNCGAVSEYPFRLKIFTPETTDKINDAEFCCIKCMREWILADEKTKEVERGHIYDDDSGRLITSAKKYKLCDLTLDELRELIVGQER